MENDDLDETLLREAAERDFNKKLSKNKNILDKDDAIYFKMNKKMMLFMSKYLRQWN